MLFESLDIYLRHTLNKMMLYSVLKFSSLQNILNCQAEYPLKIDISVEKFNECLIE